MPKSSFALIMLLLCGAALALLLYAAFGSAYSLDLYGMRPRQSIGTLNRFADAGAFAYIGAMAGAFALYLLGYAIVRQLSPRSGRLWALIIVGAAALTLALLPMYPVDAADIYDYILRGRMSALYGLNPLEDVPSQVATDPVYSFVGWRRTPSAYGPVWELLAGATSALTGALSLNQQVIAYKLLAVGGWALTGLLIGLTLRQIAPRRAAVGVYLFAWNPLVVYMTAGTGHNDALMTACMALSLYCLARRWYMAAALGAVLGTLIKFIPALLLPIIALAALRALGLRRFVRFALASALIGGTLAALCYAPYWHGLDTIRAERRALMFTGSLATVARQWLMPALDGVTDLATPARDTPNAAGLVAAITLAAFAGYYALALWSVWRADDDALLPYRAAARVMLAYLLVAALWFHAWYVLWLIALAALLEDAPLRRAALLFSYLVTWQALLYNYLVVQTRAGIALPWLDLVPAALYMGGVWAYLALYGAGAWLRRRRAGAELRADGARLRAVRREASLGDPAVSAASLSDELGIPYDHLLDYERGVRPLRLDHARALAQRFGVPLAALLGAKNA